MKPEAPMTRMFVFGGVFGLAMAVVEVEVEAVESGAVAVADAGADIEASERGSRRLRDG